MNLIFENEFDILFHNILGTHEIKFFQEQENTFVIRLSYMCKLFNIMILSYKLKAITFDCKSASFFHMKCSPAGEDYIGAVYLDRSLAVS